MCIVLTTVTSMSVSPLQQHTQSQRPSIPAASARLLRQHGRHTFCTLTLMSNPRRAHDALIVHARPHAPHHARGHTRTGPVSQTRGGPAGNSRRAAAASAACGPPAAAVKRRRRAAWSDRRRWAQWASVRPAQEGGGREMGGAGKDTGH
jgi:hypothetical protein